MSKQLELFEVLSAEQEQQKSKQASKHTHTPARLVREEKFG